MGPAFLDETGRTCFSSCLLFKGEEELNFQGKGERESLASSSFQIFEGGNSMQVLSNLAGPFQDGRQDGSRNGKKGLIQDLKTSDRKECEYAPLSDLPTIIPHFRSCWWCPKPGHPRKRRAG